MNIKKSLITLGLLVATANGIAQDQNLSSFQYVELQGGGQFTATNAKMSKLLSPTFALSYGYMTPYLGGRLHISGLQSKGRFEDIGYNYKWNYFDVNADVLLNISNLVTKKYDKFLNVYLLGGIGLVHTWKNEYQESSTKHDYMRNLRVGLRLESNITKPIGVSFEINANNMPDHFNGKLNNSSDWGFSAMLGVSYRFGRKFEKIQRTEPVEEVQLTYYQMMTNELNEQLELWSKQMPDETLEAYQLRVNDETIEEKRRMLTYEISTRMANELLGAPGTTVGNYYPSKEKLAVHLQSMPDIYLDIPANEATNFYNTNQVALKNAKYKIKPDDSFEVVYAEVNNPKTNKVYVFNNMQETSLAAIKNDPNSVPLGILYQTQMEETKLQAIKDDIANLAYQKQLISDKTHINVETGIQPEKTADGRRIINYDVKMSYEVEQKYSARDDFKPGHYLIEESGAAMAMLSIMEKAFQEDFAKYCVDGKRVLFKITGTADAAPIRRALAYKGQYGEHHNAKVNINGTPGTLDLTVKEGIKTNEQLSFARALGVKNYIDTKQTAFKQMNREYEYNVEVSPDKGSQYRRISVECLFIDAF